jgi:hypothetical protein
MRLPEADQLMALVDRSDPLLGVACTAGFTIVDLLQLGLSPLVFWCNNAWVPLLERMCPKFGYVYEWVPVGEYRGLETQAWHHGEVVLTKVG